VTRLRRCLGDASLVPGGDGTYALAVDPEAVDTHRVLRDLGAATALLDAGDHAAAVARSDAGLARFRGDVLPAAGEWALPQRARFEEARLRLTETRLAGRLRLGEDVVGELEAAVAAAPHREELWELLITALYRAGRQAEALAAYRRVRALLADELALEPGPRLRELERRVLTQDPGLGVPAGNLPALAVELVARDDELAAVRELLRAHRLVEVTGTGGVGKTAVAVAVGRLLVGLPVWLVRLETAKTADEVLDEVLGALAVVGGEPALECKDSDYQPRPARS